MLKKCRYNWAGWYDVFDYETLSLCFNAYTLVGFQNFSESGNHANQALTCRQNNLNAFVYYEIFCTCYLINARFHNTSFFLRNKSIGELNYIWQQLWLADQTSEASEK